MWVLDTILHAPEGIFDPSLVDRTLHFVEGHFIVGRKLKQAAGGLGADIVFKGDGSISRQHCQFTITRLPDPFSFDSRPCISITDLGSSFGTFVNDVKLAHQAPQELQEGDVLAFGKQRGQVRYLQLTGVMSRLNKHNRPEIVDHAAQIGMHLTKEPSKRATHCVTDTGSSFVATLKILWALVYEQPIITVAWMMDVLARQELHEELPRLDVSIENDAQYVLNENRRTLFSGIFVLFFRPIQVEGMIQEMGGTEYAVYRHQADLTLKAFQIMLEARGQDQLLVVPEVKPSKSDRPMDEFLQLAMSKGGIVTGETEFASIIVRTKRMNEPVEEQEEKDNSHVLDTFEEEKNEQQHKRARVSSPEFSPHEPKKMKYQKEEKSSVEDLTPLPTMTMEDEENTEMSTSILDMQENRISTPDVVIQPPEDSATYVSESRSRNRSLNGTPDQDGWISKPTGKTRPDCPSRELDENELAEPVGVIVSQLIVASSPPGVSARPFGRSNGHANQRNGKTFRKGNVNVSGCQPHEFIPFSKMIATRPMDSVHSLAMEKEEEEWEQQERLANELFDMREKKGKSKRIKRYNAIK